jgi:hypothetical protein
MYYLTQTASFAASKAPFGCFFERDDWLIWKSELAAGGNVFLTISYDFLGMYSWHSV